MEIGISTDQLIDVGLNVAGFITAGLLIYVINSFFIKTKIEAVPVKKIVPVIDTSKKEAVEKTPVNENPPNKPKTNNRNIEFINLNGSEWNPGQNNIPKQRGFGQQTKQPKESLEDKQGEIINLATEIMNNRGENSQQTKTSQISAIKFPSFLNNSKVQVAGRNE